MSNSKFKKEEIDEIIKTLNESTLSPESLIREIKRISFPEEKEIQIWDLKLDLLQHKIISKDLPDIKLSQKEFEVFHYLVQHKNQKVTRAELLEKIWGFTFDPGTNSVDVYINYLRKHLLRLGRKSSIKTLTGSGYLLEEELA